MAEKSNIEWTDSTVNFWWGCTKVGPGCDHCYAETWSKRTGEKEWAYYDYRHDAKHHTNNVESFWKLFKASVRSTHIHISSQHMQRYLNEFSFRSNHRKMQNAMFDLLISRI